MSAGLTSRGLSPEQLAKLYIRFSLIWRLLGYDKQQAYKWQREGRFPLRVVEELGVLYCYSAEVDGHMRGDHTLCFHANQPEEL